MTGADRPVANRSEPCWWSFFALRVCCQTRPWELLAGIPSRFQSMYIACHALIGDIEWSISLLWGMLRGICIELVSCRTLKAFWTLKEKWRKSHRIFGRAHREIGDLAISLCRWNEDQVPCAFCQSSRISEKNLALLNTSDINLWLYNARSKHFSNINRFTSIVKVFTAQGSSCFWPQLLPAWRLQRYIFFVFILKQKHLAHQTSQGS